ncbi:phage tail sheath family protein [Janthinobacterium fluminis]|uniref:Phage tail sheath C-terminal domain-containing protein n=1 Tax=Janthinobacterium fluminis TaxID=2987524 RepID=A0ABT5K7B6_9BURK|nr:phage tail sheath C-terminal domain-containing protein [Janthinobacterium fluminis]MDC8760330.1 phage tail sheath C-terminal domain-containing protein [Janthinobacterium fluminis]
MAQYKTPGVYIVEKNAFPNSVVEVATAVPAFIGHTQSASYKGASLRDKPWRITSMAEFEACYGGAPVPNFTFAVAGDNDSADFAAVAPADAAAAAQLTLRAKADESAAALRQARGALAGSSEETRAELEAAYTAAQEAAKTAAEAAGLTLDAEASQSAQDVEQSATAKAIKLRRDATAAQAELAAAAEGDEKTAKAAAYKSADEAATAAEAGAALEAKAAAEKSAAAAAESNAAAVKAEARRARADYVLTRTAGKHLLYHSMQLFFQNGGGACYIVSVGDYRAEPAADRLEAGIDALLKEQEPTMLVIPEAMLLAQNDCYSLQQQMLMHCGYKMKNRFAILDVYDGAAELQDGPVNTFRDQVSSSFLAFGAAYYPWVNTTIVALKDLNFTHLDLEQRGRLKDLLRNELAPVLYADTTKNPSAKLKAEQIGRILDSIETDWSKQDDGAKQVESIHNTLTAISSLYTRILLAVQRKVNLMPPGAAMAGLYTMVDNTRGVWKAPANVGLASVSSPAVNITHNDQEDLNVSTTGKSINAIRSFIGEGTLVWGARTLDGNSLDWRYINVRRTMIMLEESLRLASKAYVFEPNVANTWVTIKSMARNFLTSIWKRGGLAGASPDDAFSVAVGLNETMTADDILEGILRVTILVAVSRPAEFIEITFQQQMQKS